MKSVALLCLALFSTGIFGRSVREQKRSPVSTDYSPSYDIFSAAIGDLLEKNGLLAISSKYSSDFKNQDKGRVLALANDASVSASEDNKPAREEEVHAKNAREEEVHQTAERVEEVHESTELPDIVELENFAVSEKRKREYDEKEFYSEASGDIPVEEVYVYQQDVLPVVTNFLPGTDEQSEDRAKFIETFVPEAIKETLTAGAPGDSESANGFSRPAGVLSGSKGGAFAGFAGAAGFPGAAGGFSSFFPGAKAGVQGAAGAGSADPDSWLGYIPSQYTKLLSMTSRYDAPLPASLVPAGTPTYSTIGGASGFPKFKRDASDFAAFFNSLADSQKVQYLLLKMNEKSETKPVDVNRPMPPRFPTEDPTVPVRQPVGYSQFIPNFSQFVPAMKKRAVHK